MTANTPATPGDGELEKNLNVLLWSRNPERYEEAANAIRAAFDALRRERDEAREGWHLGNGCADLAMKHRDVAEQELTAVRARIAALESKPCPYVVTSDEGTSHCALAQDDDDAARYRWLRDRGHVNGWRVNFPGDTRNSRLWVSGQSLDHAIDKELHKSAGGGGEG